jgi:hypothetical protein
VRPAALTRWDLYCLLLVIYSAFREPYAAAFLPNVRAPGGRAGGPARSVPRSGSGFCGARVWACGGATQRDGFPARV